MKPRHPARIKRRKPTPTHPPISYGTRELSLMRYLKTTPTERFNIKSYSKINNIPRSTLYDTLNRLVTKGLIIKKDMDHDLTTKGLNLLSIRNIGVGKPRRECRKNANLSTHYHDFKLPISDKKTFTISQLKILNPIDIRENKLNNLHQIIVYLEQATILIYKHQVVIRIHDIITRTVEEADIKSLDMAITLTKKLDKLGLVTKGMMLESAHFARIESQLSDFLYKIDKNYYLKLDDKRKFWIDHSDKREDETNDKDIRLRIDQFLTDVINSTSLVSDIDKMKEVVGGLIKIKAMDLKKPERITPQDSTFKGRGNYIG